MGFSRIRGHTVFLPGLNSDSLVIDAGAHRGEFSSEMAALTGARCVLIEPHPELSSNIAPPDRGTLLSAALSHQDGSQSFVFSPNLEAGSIARGSSDVHSISVRTVSLASVLQDTGADRINLLKLDIEGAEFDLIKNTPDEVWNLVDQVTIEFHDFLPEFKGKGLVEEAMARLAALGFEMCNMAFRTHGDVLFLNRDRLLSARRGFPFTGRMARWFLKLRETLGRQQR